MFGLERHRGSPTWRGRNIAWPLACDARTGRYREPYAFWQFVSAIIMDGPRPRTFARCWARVQGDRANRQMWARIHAMPDGPEKDEEWSKAFRLTVGAVRANLVNALAAEAVDSPRRGMNP